MTKKDKMTKHKPINTKSLCKQNTAQITVVFNSRFIDAVLDFTMRLSWEPKVPVQVCYFAVWLNNRKNLSP